VQPNFPQQFSFTGLPMGGYNFSNIIGANQQPNQQTGQTGQTRAQFVPVQQTFSQLIPRPGGFTLYSRVMGGSQ
jgi:hypothetical protein